MEKQMMADKADMIIAGYAYFVKEDYVEVVDLENTDSRAIIQNGDVIESLMDDTQDEIVLDYYKRNKCILEESLNA